MLKFALIGCGRISKSHVQALKNNFNKIKLVAVCDAEVEKAKLRAKEYEALILRMSGSVQEPSVYEDYKNMLENEKVDVVSICTESGYHAKIAIDCMEQGKHVIVEKPMALSIFDAENMILSAEENNVKLCVCHQNRFNPSIQKLRAALDAGRFGRIIAGNARILWNRNEDYYHQASWRGTYELDGGCLMNQCIHNIDLLQWMLGGQVEWVNGIVGNYQHPYIEAEDYGSIQIQFQNGAIGNVEGTVNIYPKNLEETLSIIGENGFVSIGGLAVNQIEAWQFADQNDDFATIAAQCNQEINSVYGSGHTPLYKNMIESIQQNKTPYIDGRQGKIAMEIILAAYQSHFLGKRISFPICGDIKTKDFINCRQE